MDSQRPAVPYRVDVWTGRIDADLLPRRTRHSGPPHGLALATVEVSLRLDVVSWWIGSRNLAVADRDMLRAWLATPTEPLRVDDLVFVMVDRQLCLHINGAGPYAMAHSTTRRLVEVL